MLLVMTNTPVRNTSTLPPSWLLPVCHYLADKPTGLFVTTKIKQQIGSENFEILTTHQLVFEKDCIQMNCPIIINEFSYVL